MADVKYPNAHAKLIGKDGNTLALASIVMRAILNAGYGKEAADTFFGEVFECASYDEFLRLAMRTVNVS